MQHAAVTGPFCQGTGVGAASVAPPLPDQQNCGAKPKGKVEAAAEEDLTTRCT